MENWNTKCEKCSWASNLPTMFQLLFVFGKIGRNFSCVSRTKHCFCNAVMNAATKTSEPFYRVFISIWWKDLQFNLIRNLDFSACATSFEPQTTKVISCDFMPKFKRNQRKNPVKFNEKNSKSCKSARHAHDKGLKGRLKYINCKANCWI